MRRRSLLKSRLSSSPLDVVPLRGRKPRSRRAWPLHIGTAVCGVLSLLGALPSAVLAEPAVGFAQSCAGITQDVLLGALWSGTPSSGAQHSATPFAAMVPRLSLRGTALATYEAQPRGAQQPATLEAVFGVAPGTQRAITETTFAQDSRAVMLHRNVLATVAHAFTPDIVEVQVAQQASVHTVPLRVTTMAVEARPGPNDAAVAAQVAHMNVPYDLALAQVEANRLLQPLPYPAVLSYGTGEPEKPVGGLQAGDCVAAIVTVRGDKSSDTGYDRLVLGKVLAKVPVATNILTQTKLNVNMFTTDLPVQPGDSGSPVLALQDGKPVLVGLVSSTMFPSATFTYVTRIDPLLAMAEALRLAALPATPPMLVQSADQVKPPAQ